MWLITGVIYEHVFTFVDRWISIWVPHIQYIVSCFPPAAFTVYFMLLDLCTLLSFQGLTNQHAVKS